MTDVEAGDPPFKGRLEIGLTAAENQEAAEAVSLRLSA
jgi:hypothetical protein